MSVDTIPHSQPKLTRWADHEQENSSSARKRKREEYEGERAHYTEAAARRPTVDSRDLMPPPLPKQKPQQRASNNLPEVKASSAIVRPSSSRQAIQSHHGSVQDSYQLGCNGVQPIGRDDLKSQSGAHAQMALPYRPSVAGSNASRGSVRDLATLGANLREVEREPHSPTARYGYAQRQTTQGHLNQQQQHMSRSNHEDNGRQFSREPFTAPQYLQHQDPSNGFDDTSSSRQQHGKMRAPLQALSDFETNRRVPVTPRMHQQSAAMPLHNDSSQPRQNGPSPFFQRNDRLGRPPPTQRPPTRGSMVRTERYAPTQDGSAVQRMPLSTYAYPGNIGQFRDSDGLPSTSYSVQRSNHISTHNPQFRRPNVASQYVPRTPVPQTPRNSQGLFHRPDRAPPTVGHYNSKPQANINRSRISLPPDHISQMQMASSRDGALLHVPGVRGLSSQYGMPNQQRLNSAYGDPRNLFSSAGGRRSVLR